MFSNIVDRIKKSDFCVFDDRETEIHPNVLIELGATIALGRPYFYFNFQRKRPVWLGGKKVQVTTPSDLDGMLYLGYSDCLKLAAELALKLPQFLVQRNLASIVASRPTARQLR